MPNQPWSKFFWADWRSDPRLRMCSLAARGLWMEILALMNEAEPRGHLLVSGRAPTDAQLAILAGASPGQLPALIGELESAGVFSRTGKGVIFSRRVVRDEKKARMARKNGKLGGNPSIGKQTENGASVNPPVNPGVKPHIPEAISQNNSVPNGTGALAPPDTEDVEGLKKASYAIARKIGRPSAPTELLKVNLSWLEVYAAMVTASSKTDPPRYLAGIIRNRGGPDDMNSAAEFLRREIERERAGTA